LSELGSFARTFIWWKRPSDSVARPLRVIAQVMELGSFDDVEKLVKIVGEEALKEALRQAEPGWFSPPSWHFWHYKLGVAEIGSVPPMPERKIP
jgi:hypothetical protein